MSDPRDPDGTQPGPDDRTDRLERLLLDTGFEVDPDHELTGRLAEETAAAADDGAPDPWAGLAPTTTLSAEQRRWVEATSPALSGALPASSLTADDPFGPLDADDLARADDDVIDFD